MFKDFLFNATIIILYIFIVGQFFKVKSKRKNNTYMLRVVFGAFLGTLGVILMYYSIRITEDVVADMRQIAIVLSAMYGGPVAAFVSASVISVGRLLLWGFSEHALIAALTMIVIGIVIGQLSKLRLQYWVKGFLLNVVSITMISLTFYLILDDSIDLVSFLIYYWTISIAFGAFIFYFAEYISKANSAVQKLIESEDRYKSLVELSPEGIMVLQNDTIIFMNEHGARLFGAQSSKEMIGQSLLSYSMYDQIVYIQKNIERILAEKCSLHNIERTYHRLDGLLVELEYSASYVEYDSEPSILLMFRDITKRKEAEQKLKEMNEQLVILSSYDSLTGVANRRTFDKRLQEELELAKAEHYPLSLMMFDIDFFKKYNDHYGHQAGDEALKMVATTANEIISNDGLLARYGGEEFIIVIPKMSAADVVAKAEHLRQTIENLHIEHQKSDISSYLTISIGVAIFHTLSNERPEQLVSYTDKALYEAKNGGRNRVHAH